MEQAVKHNSAKCQHSRDRTGY